MLQNQAKKKKKANIIYRPEVEVIDIRFMWRLKWNSVNNSLSRIHHQAMHDTVYLGNNDLLSTSVLPSTL